MDTQKRQLINAVINQAMQARAQGAPTPAPDQSSMAAPQPPVAPQPSLGAAQVAAPQTAGASKPSGEDSPAENKLILQMLVKRAGKMLNNMGQ